MRAFCTFVRLPFAFCLLIAVQSFLGVGILTVSAGTNVWTSIGPFGGEVQALAIDPQNPRTVYAATGGSGLFKSTDGGGSWSAANNPLSGGFGFLTTDPQNPSTVYGGNGSSTVKSTDGGATWSNFGPTASTVRRLAFDSQNSAIIYALTASGDIFKSTDGGVTWNNSGLLGAPVVYVLVVDPQTPSTIYAGTFNGLFKSTDSGASWSNSGFPHNYPVFSVAVDPKTPSTLYATDSASSGGGIFKSINGGINWSPANSGLPLGGPLNLNPGAIGLLAINPQTPSTLYAAGSWTENNAGRRGVFKSTDGGANWSPAYSGLSGIFVTSLVIDPQSPSTVYAGSGFTGVGSGVYKSMDGGANWSPSNAGLTATSVSHLTIDPQNSSTLYASSRGILKSTDRGANWSAVNAGIPTIQPGSSLASAHALAIDPQNTNTVYAGTELGVFKSTDGGANWNAVNAGLPTNSYAYGVLVFVSALTIDPHNSDTLYVGTGRGVFKSGDGGRNWGPANPGLPELPVTIVAIDPQNSNTVYAVIDSDFEEPPYVGPPTGVFKSTDGGASWSSVNSGLPTEPNAYVHVSTLTIDPQSSGTLYAGTASGIFKSTNGGASWSSLDSGLVQIYINSLVVDPINSNKVYAGTVNGVFRSTDGGSTWNAVNSGLSRKNVQTLAIDPQDPNRLYAGTSGGGAFAITFVPDLAVTDLRFDRMSVAAGGSFSVIISGPNLTSQTFFDVRFSTPGSSASDVALNWQRGVALSHDVSPETGAGTWTINGVRAHEVESDHTGIFFPLSATITVFR